MKTSSFRCTADGQNMQIQTKTLTLIRNRMQTQPPRGPAGEAKATPCLLAQEIGNEDACIPFHEWARRMIANENQPATLDADVAAPASRREIGNHELAANDSDNEGSQQ